MPLNMLPPQPHDPGTFRQAFAALGRGAAYALLYACLSASGAMAESLAHVLKTERAYDLVQIDGQAPSRALRFYIGGNSAFAICGHCVCGTGVMTARYPNLGIVPTSASPTLDCKQTSSQFGSDAELIGRFFEMKRAKVTQTTVTFTEAKGHAMVFRLGGTDLSPP